MPFLFTLHCVLLCIFFNRTRLKFMLQRRTAQVVARLGRRGGGKPTGIGIETGIDTGNGTAKAKTAIGRTGIKIRDIASAIPAVPEITTGRETGSGTRSVVKEIKIVNGRGNATAVAAGSSVVRRRRKSTALRLYYPSTTYPRQMHSATPVVRLATIRRRHTSAYRHQPPLPRA